jgi:competence protein ComEC
VLRTAIQSLRRCRYGCGGGSSVITIFIATSSLLFLCENYIPTWTAYAQTEDSEMKIFFVDVQGGSSTLVMLPNGKTLLIDGGTQSVGGEIIVNLLQELNITKVDTVVATHPHRDHVGGLINVIRSFPVGEILDPGIKVTDDVYNELISAINSSNTRHRAVHDGDEILLDPSVKIEVLNPPTSLPIGLDATHEDSAFVNNFSVVIKLSYNEFDILFPGDILSGGQEGLLDNQIDVKVLLAPHHGTTNSLKTNFLLEATPEVVIISPGLGSESPTDQGVLDRLRFIGAQEIVNTAIEGTVMLVTDGYIYEIMLPLAGRIITIPEFNNIQIIFVLGIGIILIPILIINTRKLYGR